MPDKKYCYRGIDPIDFYIKAEKWYDPRNPPFIPHKYTHLEVLHTPTSKEVEDRMLMQGSFHTANEWVGLHIMNLWKTNIRSIDQIEEHIAARLVERPDLKNAYDLFMKPFRNKAAKWQA